jgi:hypothetical protein
MGLALSSKPHSLENKILLNPAISATMTLVLSSGSNRASSSHDIDFESRALGEDILTTVTRPVSWDVTIRSQVLKDVFHVFNMLRLSTMHGLGKEFGRALWDILFVSDKEDRMWIATWATKLNTPKHLSSWSHHNQIGYANDVKTLPWINTVHSKMHWPIFHFSTSKIVK